MMRLSSPFVRRALAALCLAGVLLPLVPRAGQAQKSVQHGAGGGSGGQWASHAWFESLDPRLFARTHAAEAPLARAPSLSRHVVTGAGIGAAAGALFGLAVISMADCGGSGCALERVLGVAGTTLGGAGVGALGGLLVYGLRSAVGR